MSKTYKTTLLRPLNSNTSEYLNLGELTTYQIDTIVATLKVNKQVDEIYDENKGLCYITIEKR